MDVGFGVDPLLILGVLAGSVVLTIVTGAATTWSALSTHLDRKQLIEFCLLTAQYDGLAATLATLKIPLDFPD